jgi:hypothetical protein
MKSVYEDLYKECLGGKGSSDAGDVRMFVAPFKSNPDSGQDLRIETLIALKSFKGEKLVRYVAEACALHCTRQSACDLRCRATTSLNQAFLMFAGARRQGHHSSP